MRGHMATNLTIRVPDELRAAVEAAASAEGRTVDAVILEATELFLEAKRRENLVHRWRRISDRGQERSAKLGYLETDVDRLMHEDRGL